MGHGAWGTDACGIGHGAWGCMLHAAWRLRGAYTCMYLSTLPSHLKEREVATGGAERARVIEPNGRAHVLRRHHPRRHRRPPPAAAYRRGRQRLVARGVGVAPVRRQPFRRPLLPGDGKLRRGRGGRWPKLDRVAARLRAREAARAVEPDLLHDPRRHHVKRELRREEAEGGGRRVDHRFVLIVGGDQRSNGGEWRLAVAAAAAAAVAGRTKPQNEAMNAMAPRRKGVQPRRCMERPPASNGIGTSTPVRRLRFREVIGRVGGARAQHTVLVAVVGHVRTPPRRHCAGAWMRL